MKCNLTWFAAIAVLALSMSSAAVAETELFSESFTNGFGDQGWTTVNGGDAATAWVAGPATITAGGVEYPFLDGNAAVADGTSGGGLERSTDQPDH